PARHVIVVFSCFERPRVEAEKIFKSMEEHGSEWIVVLGQEYGAPMMTQRGVDRADEPIKPNLNSDPRDFMTSGVH
ncbi:MAG: hypothetical protein LBE64_18955, partial [Acinetobacter pittii]|nr:hypothetical protein [Acinetobacter pittii]